MAEKGAPRVCIVGAGVAGLCACRHFLKLGLEPVVFEARENVGGVWRTATVSVTRLQTPSFAYQYSDFPWPEGTPEDPSGQEVVEYLDAYARHFGVLDRIQFNCRVNLIRKSGDLCAWHQDQRPWKVEVQRRDQESAEEIEFDFVVLCVGRFGDVPHIPEFSEGQGPEVFRGKVVHTQQYSELGTKEAMKLVTDRRVVVVGFSKSALDVAAEVAKANERRQGQPCTIVFRRSHWLLSGWNAFGIHLMLLYGNRLSEMLVAKPGQGPFSSIISWFLAPVRWAVSKFVEASFRYRHPLSKYGLVPTHSFSEAFGSCKISTAPDNLFDNLRQGFLAVRKTSKWHFFEGGVVLDDGKKVEADVVILGTGFKGDFKLRSIFDKQYADVLQELDGSVPLYRGLIQPRLPNMAILGYQLELANIRTFEMGARWLAHLVAGRFKLPDVKTMEVSAQAWLRYSKTASRFYDSTGCITSIRIWHTDELCRDIGWNPRRKKNWFQELLSPYTNMDYVD